MMRDDLERAWVGAGGAKTCTKCMGPWSRDHDCIYPLGARGADSDAATPQDAPGAIVLAREVLEHINDWATLDREGERFPWIAARTAEALAALAREVAQ